MKTLLCLMFATLGLVFAACDAGPKSTRRLHLPPGNAEKGKAAFIALKCTECHTVNGVDLPKPTAAPDSILALGGEVARLRTVGDLMTSIVHPTDRISDQWKTPTGKGGATSPMPTVNEVMTVAQLLDLVAFLQPRYTAIPPPPYEWSFGS